MQDINKILRTKPYLKNIDNDLQRITKIHHLWLDWTQSDSNKKLPLKVNILKECVPLSVCNNTLTIVCNSPIIANHIRFSAQTLIQSFLEKGINDVNNINAIVSSELNATNSNPSSSKKKILRPVSADSIEALSQLQRSCSSGKLNSSLQRLLETLCKNSKENSNC